MKKKTVYEYHLENGGAMLVSSKVTDCTEMFRIVADEGKLVTDGDVKGKCILTTADKIDTYYEIEEVKEE